MRVPSVLFMALAIGILTGFHLWSLDFSMTWTAAGYIAISSVVTWLIAFNTYLAAVGGILISSIGGISNGLVETGLKTFSVVILGSALNGWIVGGLLVATAGVMLISRWMEVPADPHGEVLTAPAGRHARRGPQLEVVLLSVTTAAGWGLAPVIIQLAERSVSGPSATMMLQSQVLGLALVAPLARRRGAFFTRRLTPDERRLAVWLVVASGALEATFSVFYYLLIDHLGAVLTTIIVASSPIFSIVGGMVLLRERLGLRLALGAAVTLAGVFLALAGS